MKGYLSELNAQAEEERARHAAAKQAQTAAAIAAARERFTPLDVRLGRLLNTIPPEVQAEGLSIAAVQVKLRPRGHNPAYGCHIGELAAALRRFGFVRERRWRDGRSSFRALWRKRQVRTPIAAASSTLIEDA